MQPTVNTAADFGVMSNGMINIYLVFSFIVGLIIIVDGYLITKDEGFVSKVSAITSSIEFIWALVSIIALWRLEFLGLKIVVPIIYISYNVFGWLYGFWLEHRTPTEDLKNIHVPVWFSKLGLNFGILFSIVSACVLFQTNS